MCTCVINFNIYLYNDDATVVEIENNDNNKGAYYTYTQCCYNREGLTQVTLNQK